MTLPSSAIIILIVIAFAFYLIYNQNNQARYIQQCPTCRYNQMGNHHGQHDQLQYQQPQPQQQLRERMTPSYQPQQVQPLQLPQAPQITNVTIDNDSDPYSDAIKKQDLYTMYDPLTYPQLRLPREVLDRYNEYYNKTGTYPPFNQATQPYLFDNPVLNGVLIKQVEPNEPFNDNIPNSVPLFRVKSVKNANRYFYYIIDQRYLSKVEPKIPLDNVRVNGIRYDNADFYGIPELMDGDCIEHVSVFVGAKFRVTLYKSYHFP